MSIKKIDCLNYEREFSTNADCNDSHDIEFNKDGIEINYDAIGWDDIKAAYKMLFKEDLEI